MVVKIGALSISRLEGESLWIDGAEVVLIEARRGKAKLVVRAPVTSRVDRDEIRRAREQGGGNARA